MRRLSFLLILLIFSLVSCNNTKRASSARSGQSSKTTGWGVSDMELYGFKDPEFIEQQTGPGLKLVQGGTFIMGRIDEDVMGDWDNQPRRVTVASFYMDEVEVTNYAYRQYLAWLNHVYPGSEKKSEATPDTLVWRSALAYNEPYVNNYFRHPSYSNYPVVGVSWIQASQYCKWRTDRVNEFLLIENGYLSLDSAEQNANVFTTEGYIAGYYTGVPGREDEKIRWENGLLLPNYRLPTESEWEYAALGLIGEADGELLTERRMYPWSGQYIRQEDKLSKGFMKANYTRGRGDLMGMAGALNDAADISADVFSFEPNDYGLYCMAGNVNEWVSDVYRPLSPMDIEEFQPYRGNVVTEYVRENKIVDKDGNLIRYEGKMIFDDFGQPRLDTIEDYRNYGDGDFQSVMIEGSDWNTIQPDKKAQSSETTSYMYIQEEKKGVINSMITDEVRVYKGGSWRDRAYWLNPGSRRYLSEKESKSDLGFRCAMTRLGPPVSSR